MPLDCCVTRSSTSRPIPIATTCYTCLHSAILFQNYLLTLSPHSTTRDLNGSETMDALVPVHIRIPWRVQPCFDADLTRLDLDNGCPTVPNRYHSIYFVVTLIINIAYPWTDSGEVRCDYNRLKLIIRFRKTYAIWQCPAHLCHIDLFLKIRATFEASARGTNLV
jgi:hypothetical protein